MSDLLGTGETEGSADGLSWTKSTLSHANGNCVQIANWEDGGHVGMRDSKNVGGPVLKIAVEEWRAFLGAARNGEFDFLLA
jgi:Domain of unknown function (DUF397)